jgi:hypothetical protein
MNLKRFQGQQGSLGFQSMLSTKVISTMSHDLGLSQTNEKIIVCKAVISMFLKWDCGKIRELN